MADPKAPEMYLCASCSEWDVTHCDEDMCCLSCGCQLTAVADLKSMLSAHGLHIVSEADVRALANYRDMLRADYAAAAAELQRRGSNG